ncbi:MAG: dihydrolipoyl dehydrogenase [Alphaproteobacteria bacterium]|nr:dihydrolipoyl dehydrogenase [Alphaproteobacteria bacterium]
MTEAFDLIIIGGGPGGYVAAIRAAQLGLKTACVEKRGALGGTCLNVGCIPSKALLESSEKFEDASVHFAAHGISVKPTLDLTTMQARKTELVTKLGHGIEGLFKKNKVAYIKGLGTITGKNEVTVEGTKYTAKNIVIATGSEVTPLPGITIDEKQIVSSTGALELDTVPKHLVVIGAGVIGLELGSVWRRLGAKVTVLEYLDRITPGIDGDMAKQFQKLLEKQGFEFKLGQKVTSAKSSKSGVEVAFEPAAGGAGEKLVADVVLVAVGRRAYTDKLGLDSVGLATNMRGQIDVNAHWQTAVPHIYAIGDVIAGPMLAHKAEEEGVAVAEFIAGQKPHINYNTIPSVVYTHPELASVGKTEEELKAANVAYKVGKFPFMANSRSRATGQIEGMVKILADSKTDEVLGVHILGPQAGGLIHEACIAMEFGASAEDIARTCHAHPTYNEAVKEAAFAVAGRAIHM